MARTAAGAGTPSARWRADIVRLRKSCQGVCRISKKIRYVGVINKYGRTLTGILRPGTKPLLSSEHTKNEFFLMSSLLNMRNASVKSIGRLDHITLQHEKVYIVLLQRGDHLYYISVDVDVRNISKLILKIKGAI